jgi:hypothetical protein
MKKISSFHSNIVNENPVEIILFRFFFTYPHRVKCFEKTSDFKRILASHYKQLESGGGWIIVMNERWDWFPRINQSLDRIPSLKKKSVEICLTLIYYFLICVFYLDGGLFWGKIMFWGNLNLFEKLLLFGWLILQKFKMMRIYEVLCPN